VIDRLHTLGNVPAPGTPAGFKQRVAADVAKWTKVVADAGIKRVSAQ
jgi:tripartite-type tricarboxylate transporter receptor subunit TctC